MKKKLLIAGAVLAVVLVALVALVVPYRVKSYDDGGTKEYRALTYRVVTWNRISADERYEKTRVYFGGDVFQDIDRLWAREEANIEHQLVARISDYMPDSFLAEPLKGEWEATVSPCISVQFSSADLEKLGADVGSYVEVTYRGLFPEDGVICPVSVKLVKRLPDDEVVDYKPVIYLYPEQEMEVSVKMDYNGRLTCTYPAYGDGWTVTAKPDGTLTDDRGQIYNYLYWEGVTNARYDLSRGFCVRGEDTAAFLEEALAKLGLNRREANEFIVYWLPLMEQNPYNVISFQTDCYTEAAKLDIDPAPDSLIRVFMAWQASESFVDLPQQPLTAPERQGFTVVEWGGTELE